MTDFLTKRIQSIAPSPTMASTAKARQMKQDGLDVLSFTAGEPDFDTPEAIKSAAIKAIEDGQTKYTPVPGTTALKTAILKKLKRDQGLDYAPEEVMANQGGKHSLYNIMQVLIESGDEVIIPAPYWVSYPAQVILADGKPVVVTTNEANNFCMTPEQLEEAITPKTKALILNTPSNPTGSAYTKEQLQALVDVCLQHDIWIISDEIYEKIVYDGFEHISPAQLGEAAKAKTLIVNGVSKGYAMTGWRMGFTAGDKTVIAAMSKLQGQSTSGISSITQAACVEALGGPQDAIAPMVKAFDERRRYVVDAFNAIDGIDCRTPQGAFYVFPNVTSFFGKKTPEGKLIENDADLCNYLLEKHLVALVAGEGFGAPGFIRLSYAASMGSLQNGLDRISKALQILQ